MMGLSTQIAVKFTEIIVGQQPCSQSNIAVSAAGAVGAIFLAFKALRNFYYDITD